jgi:hypothetical protein
VGQAYRLSPPCARSNLSHQPELLLLRRHIDWIALDSRREPALCRESELLARKIAACLVDPTEQFARRLETALLGRYESQNDEFVARYVCQRFE